MRSIFLILTALLFSFEAAHAQPKTGASSYTRYLTLEESHSALPPQGHFDFCEREPYECRRIDGPTTIRMDAAVRAIIERGHQLVLRSMRQVTDMEVHGIPEYWGPTNKRGVLEGDCEDFVLLVRRALVELSIPENAMRIVFVRDEQNEGHAVLAILGKNGRILISDVKKKQVVDWYTLPYTWLRWTEAYTPKEWRYIVDPRKKKIAQNRKGTS